MVVRAASARAATILRRTASLRAHRTPVGCANRAQKYGSKVRLDTSFSNWESLTIAYFARITRSSKAVSM
jgi:hypothetical protein